MLMSRQGLPRVAAALPAARVRERAAGGLGGGRTAARARRERARPVVRLRAPGGPRAGDAREPARSRGRTRGQPDERGSRFEPGPAQQAGGRAPALSGDGVCAAIPGRGCACRAASGGCAHRRRLRHRVRRAGRGISRSRVRRGSRARRGDDRRQGRPHAASLRAAESRGLRAHRRAAQGRDRDRRREGDHHRRAVHARAARDAVPEHDRGGRGLRRLLRGAGGRGEPHAGRATGGTPGRSGGEVQREVRPVHGGRDLRSGVRAVGARVPRRRVAALGLPHLSVRAAPPPDLHRGARRVRRPADRRERADDRGERRRPRRRVATCADRWSS